MTTYTCDRCEQEFVPVKESYNVRCKPCADAVWREQRYKPKPKPDPTWRYHCWKCKTEIPPKDYYGDPETLLFTCSDCMVADIMKYADTFGVD